MSEALFVDLPNLYTGLLDSRIDDPRLLRDYFLLWFDFDRLAERLTGVNSPVWVFYSGRRFGPKPNRVEGDHLQRFIARCNSQMGVTAYDVNIPGEQREAAKYHCEECGHEGVAQWESEKGIDSSLAVRMFDTADSWETAYLLSGDADFVPAVASLRRRGKIVVGAGFAEPSSALVRECYYFHDLAAEFFRDDIIAFRVFGPEGLASVWLSNSVDRDKASKDPDADVRLQVIADYWKQGEWTERSHLLNFAEARAAGPVYQTYFLADGPVDLSNRENAFAALEAAFPMYFEKRASAEERSRIQLSALSWNGIDRRVAEFGANHPNVTVRQRGNTELSCSVAYKSDPTSGAFILLNEED